jgi:hypothetical protein
MTGNGKIFEEYVDRNKGFNFFKRSKSWVIIVTVLVAVVLAWFFYKTAILERMSSEEVQNSIEVVWQDTAWVDKKSNLPNKVTIVPSISFKIKNIGLKPLQYISFEGIFEFEDSGQIHNDGWTQAVREPIAPGEVSKEIFIKCFNGYSASSKESFLKNMSEWKRMRVKIYARTKGSQLVRIGDIYPVKQEIKGIKGISLKEKDEVRIKREKETQELQEAITIEWQDSKWVDRLIYSRKTIIVPSITIKVKNLAERSLENIYFKGIFEYEKSGKQLSEGFVQALQKPLKPGDTSEEILIKAEFGYTATSKEAFIRNRKDWERVKVRVLTKSKYSDYVLLGTYPVKQEIQGVKVVYH